jgi:two-component system chemotaxis response regulator CheY
MKRCLLADNSAIVRKVAKHFLNDDGWHVDEAETADAVMAAYRASAPDLAILDWQLAGMPSEELIGRLRKLDDNSSTRIIFLTSEENRRTIWQALRCGADQYMMKPFDRASFSADLKESEPRAASPLRRLGTPAM